MNFKTWLLLTESIEQNFNQWIEDIKKYAQPNELELKTINVDEKQKELIIQALKKAKQEKQEYLKYLLGFIENKPHALPEDFDRSLDAIKWAITTNKIRKQQIANDGWYNTGKKSQDFIRMKDEEDSSVSKRQIARDKKSGISYDLTPEFVSGNYKIYFIPKITEEEVEEDNIKKFSKLKIANQRHVILCKYGKDTEWCTASPTGTYHANYAHRDIYVVHENDKPVFQFTRCTNQNNDKPYDNTCQFMDTKDVPAKKIPYELAELIMKKLPDIGKFYKVVYSSFFINKIGNAEIKTIEDILKIFQFKTLDELTYDYIDYLILYSKNKDLITELIINNKKEISDNNIKNLIFYANDKLKIAKVIVNKNLKYIFNNTIFNYIKPTIDEKEKYNIVDLIIKNNPEINQEYIKRMLSFSDNKETIDKIAELITNNKKELYYTYVDDLMKYVTDKDKFAELIINKQPELSDNNVDNLMNYVTDKVKFAEMIINKQPELSRKNIDTLMKYVTDKDKFTVQIILKNGIELSKNNIGTLIKNARTELKIAKAIFEKKLEISNDDAFQMLYQSKNKIKMASFLNSKGNYINNFSADNVYSFLEYSTNLYNIAKILGKENLNKLKVSHIEDLLQYSGYNDVDDLAEVLGSDNISKLDDITISSLFDSVDYSKTPILKNIIKTYHKNITPEIQEILDGIYQEDEY